jgi:tripartite-type tricarboxylate transporter receptor subunit TctC
MQLFVRYLAMPAVALVCGSATDAAHAQETYPAKPVRIIVAFAPGGIGDTVARILGVPLAQNLGEPVIIENRAGADGMIGTEVAAKAPADGYTILQVASPQAINTTIRETRYDLLRDFIPVAQVFSSPLVLVTSASSPNRTVADLVASAKTKPQGLNYGSGGVGSVGHLSAEMLKRAAGISGSHVAYKGNSAVMIDLVGGRLDFLFASPPEAIQGAASGQLRVLAVTSSQRMPTFPKVPTMIESGFPGFDPSGNYGYMVPRNTPAPIVKKLEETIARSVASTSVQERLQSLGVTAKPSGSEQYGIALKSEIERWRQVIKAEHIRAE